METKRWRGKSKLNPENQLIEDLKKTMIKNINNAFKNKKESRRTLGFQTDLTK